MHQVNRKAIVKHPSKHMFDLVNDIKNYPRFLKWCYESHVLEDHDDVMVAGLTVSLAGFKQKFTTRNRKVKEESGYRVNLNLENGPFEHLSGYWVFTDLNATASKIELFLEFNFKSGLLNNAFKKGFGAIAQQLVTDFVKRAGDLYG